MKCQVCESPINKIMSLGYMPPVNWMPLLDDPVEPQTWLPTELMHCPTCELVQLGCIADSGVVFPPDYPYTSGSTRILVDNFEQQAEEAIGLLSLKPGDLVVDIGSNDGTLLQAYKRRGMKVFGVEPTDIANLAFKNGIETLKAFFTENIADYIGHARGEAALVTCCNCFAHIPDVHGVIKGIKRLLRHDGTFLSESHYLMGLLKKVQYDTIYHEHLRYYSITSLDFLLRQNGLQIVGAREIPTHGGSIRVYATFGSTIYGNFKEKLLGEVTGSDLINRLARFKLSAMEAQCALISKVHNLKRDNKRVVGIGAPSRASVVISYCRLGEDLIDYVCEREGSLKIGRYMPGTRIPVVSEDRLIAEQPEAAIVFSHHIFDEIETNLRAKGYRGELVSPI